MFGLHKFFNVIQTGGSGAGLQPLVEFYSKLPKGAAPAPGFGFKAKFMNGKNGSAVPLFGTLFGIFLLGYTLDYHSA